ncbi:C3H1-type domain-containing protein [Durusdinium trenchii]|uniref:C3H1-type domain-containing protein n=1 Tax=Durusdinium trenchii TaxID=1381693 RepID=A0ABP0MCD5_9DINO
MQNAEPAPELPNEHVVDETASSGYFSNSTSSASEASDPRFWIRPSRSDGSAASVASSEFRRAAAKSEERENLLLKVPRSEDGRPTSMGSVNHPHSCLPCMFLAKPSGCIRGLECDFCHFPHLRTRSGRGKAAQFGADL